MLILVKASVPGLAYDVDKELLYELESIYQSSKLSVDISIDNSSKIMSEGEASERTNVKKDSRINANVGAIRKVERPIYGYWVDAAFDYEYQKEERSFQYDSPFIEDSVLKLKKNTFKLKEFEGAFEGFALYDYCDGGIKRYLSEQSPYYYFGQSLFYFEKVDSDSEGITSTEEIENTGDNPEILAGAGFGYGKIVDLGSYERILILQDELLDAGIIQDKFSRPTIIRLLPLFRRTMEEYDRLKRVQKILEGEGVIDKNQLSLDLAGDIVDAIDEAFEKREYGFEIRAGYLQDLVHADSDEAKIGRFYVYTKYEKPIVDTHHFTFRGDFFHAIPYSSDDDENAITGTELQLRNYLSSVWTRNLESIVGGDLIYKHNLSAAYKNRLAMRGQSDSMDELDQFSMANQTIYYPEGISTRLYACAVYEITDLLNWENEISYTQIWPNDQIYDVEKYFEFVSALVYTLW